MKYCCEKFEEKIEYVGNKGICVIPENDEENSHQYFVLQYRNYDIGYEHEVKTLSTGIHSISFCPWCGENLSNLIENDSEEFKAKARQNKHFQ